MRIRPHLEQLESRDAPSTYGFPYNVAALPGNFSQGGPASVKVSSYEGEAAGEAGPAAPQTDLPWTYIPRLDCHLLRQYRAFRPKPRLEKDAECEPENMQNQLASLWVISYTGIISSNSVHPKGDTT